MLESIKERISEHILWDGHTPQDKWHSWDKTPWNHPWLTPRNLNELKKYSFDFLSVLRSELSDFDAKKYSYAFVGNMANSLYTRAAVLKSKGYKTSTFIHPGDKYVMSHPCWEEFNGSISPGNTNFENLFAEGILDKNAVSDVYQIPLNEFTPSPETCLQEGISQKNYERYISYMSFLENIKEINKFDSMICAQTLYLAYLSQKPYAAVGIGGDIWFESSRNDVLGKLQRESFRQAKVIFASDPLTIAHCRRYGFNQGITIPHFLDEKKYSPGESDTKLEWQKKYGGDFFILTTARLDDMYKGNAMALSAIIEVLQKNKNARMALVGWGNDNDENITFLKKHDIYDQVIPLPVSGKVRLIEYLRSADCFIGQFVLGAFGYADLEAMACGVPVVGYVKSDHYENICPTGCPPVLNSQSTKDVYDHLNSLLNEAFRRKLSEKTRNWFIENHGSEKWHIDHVAVLAAMARGRKFDFSDSILNTKLSKEEKEYHKQNLRIAPKFPEYAI